MGENLETQVFAVWLVVLRNGEPITPSIVVQGAPITLHERHDPAVVWAQQAHVLTELLRSELRNVDALADVVPDTRPVGLTPRRYHTAVEAAGVPVLKRINRFLAWLNKRLNGGR